MRNLLVTLITVVVLAGLALLSPGVVPVPVRDALGIGPSPLGRAPAADGEGSYRFLQHQPGAPEVPVAYDPCRLIRVQVNTEGVDDEDAARGVVLSAMKRVQEASGLRFEYAGSSTERPRPRTSTRSALVRAEPVLVSFATSEEVPELAGRVAGIGGSTAVQRNGVRTYITGQVTLDARTFDALLDGRSRPGLARSIVLHEFGHLVGLDHVKDDRELMRSENSGRLDFGPGDLRGLAAVSRGSCG